MARESGASRALLANRCARFTEAEEGLRVARRLGGDFLHRPAEGARHGPCDVRQERGLVAPRLRLRPQVAGGQVWGVRFEEKPIGGNIPHQLKEMRAAALVADPAG